MDLLSWQRRFVTAANRPAIRTAALSLPRGNGKTTLAAWLLSERLRKVDGTELRAAGRLAVPGPADVPGGAGVPGR